MLTTGLDDQPATPEPERGSIQGAEPAPGQTLGYDDWLNNNLGNQDVGVVNARTGPDGQPEYYHTNPDGTEKLVTNVQTTPDAGLIYSFEDGTAIAPNYDGDGTVANITTLPDGFRRAEYATTSGDKTINSVDILDTAGARVYTISSWDTPNGRYGVATYLDADGNEVVQQLNPENIGHILDPQTNTASARDYLDALAAKESEHGPDPSWAARSQILNEGGTKLGAVGAALSKLDPDTTAREGKLLGAVGAAFSPVSPRNPRLNHRCSRIALIVGSRVCSGRRQLCGPGGLASTAPAALLR